MRPARQDVPPPGRVLRSLAMTPGVPPAEATRRVPIPAPAPGRVPPHSAAQHVLHQKPLRPGDHLIAVVFQAPRDKPGGAAREQGDQPGIEHRRPPATWRLGQGRQPLPHPGTGRVFPRRLAGTAPAGPLLVTGALCAGCAASSYSESASARPPRADSPGRGRARHPPQACSPPPRPARPAGLPRPPRLPPGCCRTSSHTPRWLASRVTPFREPSPWEQEEKR